MGLELANSSDAPAPALGAMPPRYAIQQVRGAERQRVASFMAAKFQQHFGASISDDTDQVFAAYDDNGEILLAFGLNLSVNTFFSQHYVSDLSGRLRQCCGVDGRETLRAVELAHLCVRAPRDLCRMVPRLARFLSGMADVLVCTATSELSSYFVRRGLAPHQLGRARVTDLPPGQRHGWGNYYEHQPLVLCGRLADASAKLDLLATQVKESADVAIN